jgi:hypothetical protein
MPTRPAPSRLGLMTNLSTIETRLNQHDATFRSNVPQHATPGGQIMAFGLISAAGVTESGSMNFTLTHTSTGLYTVKWAIAGVPKEQKNAPHGVQVTLVGETALACRVTQTTAEGFTVETYNLYIGEAKALAKVLPEPVNSAWSFLALTPVGSEASWLPEPS